MSLALALTLILTLIPILTLTLTLILTLILTLTLALILTLTLILTLIASLPLTLCLEVDARSLNKMPAREVLWEQDAWNDLAKSLELNRCYSPLQPTTCPYSP